MGGSWTCVAVLHRLALGRLSALFSLDVEPGGLPFCFPDAKNVGSLIRCLLVAGSYGGPSAGANAALEVEVTFDRSL